jgi:selenide, water dikinase
VTNAGGRAGDALVRTKPLGVGAIVTARKRGAADDALLSEAVEVMTTLNDAASAAAVDAGAHAMTDVTGFGLLGHGLEMARASGTRFVFEAAALPALSGALDLARAGVETTGAGHNRRHVAPDLTLGLDVPAELVVLAYDPQTSGGLLAAVSPAMLDTVARELTEAGIEHWQVGHIESTDSPGLVLR